MPLRVQNPKSKSRTEGFSLLEVLVALSVLAVVLFAVGQTITLVLLRTSGAMETARQEDQGARFVASITLATKTATEWGIYSNQVAYNKGSSANLAAAGNILECKSATESGTGIDYLFVYDPAARTLKRYENGLNTDRMTLKNVSSVPGETDGQIFNQDQGLVQGHWQLSVRGRLLTFAAYGTVLHMR
ncbi:MAG TPA: prepilin-type N-terminal cleavage/methylation domain-containing protein [Chthoniobacterales bacterium]